MHRFATRVNWISRIPSRHEYLIRIPRIDYSRYPWDFVDYNDNVVSTAAKYTIEFIR